jgi:hypothetical protein
MRRTLALLLLSLTVTSLASAAGWKKSYFGATKPGTWALYNDHTSYPETGDMTTTLTRLDNEGGQPRIEMKMGSGGDDAMLIFVTLKKGFATDRELIDYGKAIVAVSAGDVKTQKPLDAEAVAKMAKTMPQYEPAAVFKGSEDIDGKKADHYVYTLTHPGGSVETGELWLSDAVPFGVLRNTFTITQKSGKISITCDRKLVASGAKSQR